MSTAFWYHPESESFFTDLSRSDLLESAVEMDEQEWIDAQIKLALVHKICPADCNGVLVEARKTLSFGADPKPVLWGKIYLRHGIPDGTEINTSAIQEVLPGNIYRTRNSTYLVQFANDKDDLKDRRDELQQDAAHDG